MAMAAFFLERPSLFRAPLQQLSQVRSVWQEARQPRRPRSRGQLRRKVKTWTPEELGLDKMSTKKNPILEEDWVDLWPVARPYDHHLVQLPIRMGRPILKGEPPDNADGNAELMKIPNFLHLTPRHIRMHTEALKPFCKPWPKNESTENRILRVRTNDHVFPGPSLRHPRSHVVQILCRLDDLPNLDERGCRKLTAMASKKRMKSRSEVVSITCKECPTRQQNKEYALFQLLALWKEAQVKTDWEDEAELEDFVVYEL